MKNGRKLKEIFEIKQIGIQTIEQELEAIQQLKEQITDDFARVVQEILQASGRVIVTGVGKSAIVGSKIVATLNSTGTPSIFIISFAKNFS